MDQTRMAQQMLAERTGTGFLNAVADMAAAHPHPVGPTVRLTATAIDGGRVLGTVDVDVTNLWELEQQARARAATPARPGNPGRPALRVVGGAA